MNIIEPTPSQAAYILRRYLESVGVNIPLAVSQESIARIRGYADWNALAADINPRGKPVRTALTDVTPEDDNLQAYPRELAELSVESWMQAFADCWPPEMFRMKTEADYERLRESDLDWPELRSCEDRLRSNLYLALTACGIDDYYNIVGTPGLGAAEQGFWVQMVYERRVGNRFALRLCPTLNWDKLEVWICTHLFSDIFGEGVENETWHAPVSPGPGESLASLMSRALLVASDLATSMTGWMKADRFMRTA